MSKTLKMYIGVLIVVISIAISVESSKPVAIDWRETYNERHTKPYGLKILYEEFSKLFDKASIKKIRKTPYEYFNDNYNWDDYDDFDFIESKVSDHSGIEAIGNIARKYLNAKKNLRLTHLSPECKTLLLKADPMFQKIIKTSIDDPRYYVVTDSVDKEVSMKSPLSNN